MRRISPLLTPILIVSFLVVLSAPDRQAARGQANGEPTLIVTGVDGSSLPLMRVTVYGNNLSAPLADLPVTLSEDGVVQPILDSQPVEVGIQTGILFDLSANVLPRYNELADAVDRYLFARMTAQTDWLSVYSVSGQEGNLAVLADWSQDHQDVANQVRLQAPSAAARVTPLFGLISEALNRFDTLPAPSNLRRSLLVFSDGSDLISAQQLETITRKAARLGVAIHTIMIGNPQNAASRKNLEQISLETGGDYWDYSTADKLSQVEELWRQLGGERTQQQYTYRLTKAQPREVEVTAALPNGRTLSSRRDYPTLPVRPPDIAVLEPVADASITRRADYSDAPLLDIQPNSLAIRLQIDWPDGFPRDFDRIEYELGGRVLVQNDTPFGEIDFPIGHLDTGSHSLRVIAFDELGLESRAVPVSIAVEVVRPTPIPTDTPTPIPTDTPTPAPPTPTPRVEATVTLTTTVILTPSIAAVTPGAAVTIPGVGPVGFGRLSSGRLVLVIGQRSMALTPLNLLVALTPFLLLVVGVVLLVRMRRRPRLDPYTLTPTEPAYDPISFDNRPTVIEQTAYELTEDATEPEVVQLFVAPASLIYKEGGEHLPPKLDVEGGREVRIGRKQAYCDVIIDDQRVSRLHASITEKEDGKFYLKDEGSSGGTYVNRRKLRVNDMVELHHNDVIYFNTVAYTFVLNDQTDQQKKV